MDFKHKRKPQEDKTQVMDFVKECEEASQWRHGEIMGQIKTQFEKLVRKWRGISLYVVNVAYTSGNILCYFKYVKEYIFDRVYVYRT